MFKAKREGISFIIALLSLLVIGSPGTAEPFTLPPPELRLDYTAWHAPQLASSACLRDFQDRAGLQKLEELEQANFEIERAMKQGWLNEGWLRFMGYLQDGTEEYIKADQRRVGFRQFLLPKAHTGFLFPHSVRKTGPGIGKNNRSRDLVDPRTYAGAILLLPGIGKTVSVADTVTEIAQTFSKGGNEEFVMQNGEPFRALGVPLDVTLNGMAEYAPYIFGSRRGSMAMIRHVHLIVRAMYPHLKIAIGGRSQGGLLALAYGQTYADHGLVATIAANPTFPRGEILREANIINSNPNEEELKAKGLDSKFHPYSWRSYLEFTERDYARVIDEKSLVRALVHVGELDHGYPQPGYTNAYRAWMALQPHGEFELIREADHHFWSRPGGKGEKQFFQSVGSIVRNLSPLFYP